MSRTLVEKGKRPLGEKTREHLLEAMHGEAFAYVKYMLFSEAAKKNGHAKLAELFEKTANVERFEHFAEEAELFGLVGNDEKNLEDSIDGESYEVTTMYKDFSEEAKAAGDLAVAERFSEIRNDEKTHLAAYKSALESL
ncbi:MAG TPA: rubrerythrin family protein [Nitrososphaerales archaeon]|nr:rubrerythrin family protein [Nitrososphaerales archaeon]